MEIVPDMKGSVSAGHSVSLPEFAGEAVWWADDLSHTLRRVDDIRKRCWPRPMRPNGWMHV